MIDEYFGIKELKQVTLRAKTPMVFGSRKLEADEPVLYFENVNMSLLNQKASPVMARGGWANLPRVIWEDREAVNFTLSEGVMSSISMGILLSANMMEKENSELLVPRREGPFELDEEHRLYLQDWPTTSDKRKTFIFEYERDVAQKKVYGKRIFGISDPFEPSKERPCLEVYQDKEL